VEVKALDAGCTNEGQMAQYIHSLESTLAAAQPQPPLQPRGWAAQPWGAQPYQSYPTYPGATSGFMGNLATGLGLGAGFGLGEDLVDSIFRDW
jgi:predicted lipid-binding transport protein (Tim44 family)